MRFHTASSSLMVAAALVLAPLGSAALADSPAEQRPGVAKSQLAKAKQTARRLEAKSQSRGFVVLGGTVAAVTAAVAADPASAAVPATLTLTVHGGRYKVLRGTDVTVTLAPDAKVTRGGVVELTALLVGDHVVVKSRDLLVTVDTAVTPPTVTVTATVSRVAASPPEAEPAAPTV